MLPAKELNRVCLRCGVGVGVEQRYCAGCGADREVELAVVGQLHPAISAMQKWLGAFAVIEIVSAVVEYVYLRWGGAEAGFFSVMRPGLVGAGWLGLLCLVARVLPLAASLGALGLFGVRIGAEVMANPFAGLTPGPLLFLRILLFVLVSGVLVLFLVAVVGAVQASWKARALRREAVEAFPCAIAMFREAGAKQNR